ncbi:hypothetical protein MAR_006696, partial [Mya arenaria]
MVKADIQGIRNDLSDLADIITMNDSSIEDPWPRLKTIIHTTIEKRRAHKKARSTNNKRDLGSYKRSQKDVLKGQIQDVLAFVQSKRSEVIGVAPLKDKDGFLQSGKAVRASSVNEQFVSAFIG